jgi:hypothetical protein
MGEVGAANARVVVMVAAVQPYPMIRTENAVAAIIPVAGNGPCERRHACWAWACHHGNTDGFWFHAALPIPFNRFGGKQDIRAAPTCASLAPPHLTSKPFRSFATARCPESLLTWIDLYPLGQLTRRRRKVSRCDAKKR